MVKREWGAERRGQDDDEGNAGLTTRKVQIENAYFDKLKARLGGTHDAPVTEPTAEHADAPQKPAEPGFVIYGDDGRPID